MLYDHGHSSHWVNACIFAGKVSNTARKLPALCGIRLTTRAARGNKVRVCNADSSRRYSRRCVWALRPLQALPSGLAQKRQRIAPKQLVLRPVRFHSFAAVLAGAHATELAAHLLCRDIKPENLLLSETGVLKLADFGLAIDLNREAAVTRAGTLGELVGMWLRCWP